MPPGAFVILQNGKPPRGAPLNRFMANFGHPLESDKRFSAQLGERGITPAAVETICTITFENLTLTQSVLQTTVRAKGADKAKVEEAAAAAKAGCPISKVLKLEITLSLSVVA